jgi:hypothetical protein
MRAWVTIVLVSAALATAACSSDDREWMKVDQKYTRDEFRRDYRECTKKDGLDDACMRQRGWVSVNPSKSDAPPPPPQPARRC